MSTKQKVMSSRVYLRLSLCNIARILRIIASMKRKGARRGKQKDKTERRKEYEGRLVEKERKREYLSSLFFYNMCHIFFCIRI